MSLGFRNYIYDHFESLEVEELEKEKQIMGAMSERHRELQEQADRKLERCKELSEFCGEEIDIDELIQCYRCEDWDVPSEMHRVDFGDEHYHLCQHCE